MRLGPFIGRVLLVLAIVLGLYGLGWSVTRIGTVGRVLGLACAAAYLLHPMVGYLQNRGMSRTMAIAAVFLAFFTVSVVSGYFLIPIAQRQAVQISGKVQEALEPKQREIYLNRLQGLLADKLPEGFIERYQIQTKIGDQLGALANDAFGLVTAVLLAVVSNLIYVFLLPMITFLVLQDGPLVFYYLVRGTPNRYFEVVHRLIWRVDEQLGGYIRGMLLVTFCVGTFATAGLWICGLEYFFVIGPLMGVLNFIPIFGPLVGMALAGLAMVFQTGEFGAAIWPVLVGVAAQVMDNILFTPVAVSRSVNLHPLVVLLAILAGGEILGLVGLLLGVPAAVTIKVVWQAIQEVRQIRRVGQGAPVSAGSLT